jgi:membrane-bound lytic murein transglycosylase MltF
MTAAEQGLPPELQAANAVSFGDFDAMRERRIIRVLTVFAKGLYFLDGADQRGATYEMVKMFEEEINERFDTGNLKIHVLLIPVTRDRLFTGLVDGYGDIAAANLTITPEREALVDFGDPLLTGVDEVVVTGPAAPPLESLDDLAGLELPVRPSSSYYDSLVELNGTLQAAGQPEVVLEPVAEHLEDEDLLELVNAGLLPFVVVDSHKANFWAQIFDDITVRDDLTLRTDGEIAWAFRQDSPELREVVNAFVETHRQGTLLGNIFLNRYLRSTNWVDNSLNAVELDRFQSMIDLFQQYAGTYEFDWLLVAAQAYQESKLDQSLVSPVGAIGVMQLMPDTAADPNVGIPDILELEPNIHAGVKYLRFVRDRYFADDAVDELNAALFSFAAYNAGPARVARLRRQAGEMGLDPNVWFRNVEVAAAKAIGRETVQYVSNIYKYYTAYRRIAETLALRDAA